MEHVPYYDFSFFPYNSKTILEKIKIAVKNGVEVIIINFGSYFPWSINNIVKSEFAYTDKLIDKIVSICQENEIELIPSLSIFTNSDFLLRDNRYKYLISNSLKHSGIDVSACGTSKLVEEMIDDIYSLLRFSKYLLIEIPKSLSENSLSIKENETGYFIKRIYDNLFESDKKLILGCKENCPDVIKQFSSEDIKFLIKTHYKTTNIFKSNSYNIDIFMSKILLNCKEYIIPHLNVKDGFDPGLALENANPIPEKNSSVNIRLENINRFYHLVGENWSLIRKCWEELSAVYRNTNPIYRIPFSRSVNILNNNYEKLQISSIIILETFEDFYQPGIIREWVNTKMDSILNQLKTLKNIAKFMNEDSKL